MDAETTPERKAARLPLLELLASDAFRQLVRFVLGGLAVTLFSAIIYSAAVFMGVMALAANVISHGFGMAAGYAVHSRWSFKAETDADSLLGERAMIVRFLIASAFAFLLNSLWVWLAVDVMRLHPLSPLPAMVVLTPLMSFTLNRYWVFKAA